MVGLRRHHAPASQRGQDGGFTLIEVLVAVVLLGLAGTVVLVAWSANLRASSRHRQYATAQTLLTSAAERVVSVDTDGAGPLSDLVSCTAANDKAPMLAAYGAAAQVPGTPSGFTVSVTNVQFRNPPFTSAGVPITTSFGNTCFAQSGWLTQLVTVTVVSSRFSVSESVKVVKNGV